MDQVCAGLKVTTSTTEYTLQTILGEGVFGKVMSASNEKKEKFAIKFVTGNELRFKKEKKNWEEISKLNCDDLLSMYEYGSDGIFNFFVMEIMVMDLSSHLKQTKKGLSNLNTWKVFNSLRSALIHLEGIHLIHSDVKLTNVMLYSMRENTFEVKLIDFGSSTYEKNPPERKSYQMGNINYRSPDSILGLPITTKIDVWGLGIIMLFCSGPPKFPFIPHDEYSMASSFFSKRPDLINDEFLERCHNRDEFFYHDGDQWATSTLRITPEPTISEILKASNMENALVTVIDLCLQIDPEDRPRASQMLYH